MKLCECGCGQATNLRRGRPRRFLSGHNARGELHYDWKGGRGTSGGGYALVAMPDHPRANPLTGYVFEHIVIAERALGRFLKSPEEVHHRDGNKKNNGPGNLVICPDRAYHNLLHQRQRAVAACGHVDWRPCVFCGRHDDPERMIARTRGHTHRECRNTYHRNYLAQRRATRPEVS